MRYWNLSLIAGVCLAMLRLQARINAAVQYEQSAADLRVLLEGFCAELATFQEGSVVGERPILDAKFAVSDGQLSLSPAGSPGSSMSATDATIDAAEQTNSTNIVVDPARAVQEKVRIASSL